MPDQQTTPITSRMPNVTGVLQTSASVESGMGDLLSSFGSMATNDSGSPLASIADALQQVNSRLNINTAPFERLYPDALAVMRNALPANTLDYVRSIETAYGEAQGFLQDSALVREISASSSLQETALAAVSDVLRAFDERQLELTRGLIDPETLNAVTTALSSFQQFQTDFDKHRGDFPVFISTHLFGVTPDLLRDPLAHLTSAKSVLAPLELSFTASVLGPSRQALAAAFRDLTNTVLDFDPADAASYTRINDLLQTLETAADGLHVALGPLYAQMNSVLSSHAWDAIFPTLKNLLQAVAVLPSFSVDDAIHGIRIMIENILARLESFLGPQDLVPRIAALGSQLTELFMNSPLGQVRRVLREFLEEIRHAIESVPTEQIQQAIESMLNRVKQEIDKLGLDHVAETIEAGFREAEDFITQHINDVLTKQVGTAVHDLLDKLQGLPLNTLTNNITNAIQQVQSLLAELEAALKSGMDKLSEILAKLEDLSFKPVSDPVIGEINELKTRLRAINPNALSDVEKLAIKGALAVLEAIDLEGFITGQVKSGFDTAKNGVKQLLDDLTAALNTLKEQLEQYRPQQLVSALTAVLDEALRAVNNLNGRTLLQPLYDQLDNFSARLQAISPGSLLDPLQPPFETVVSAVNELNPDRLLAPLNALYAEIDKLIAHVDVTPLFDELDKKQKELFTAARNSILSALDNLSLPEPLAGFLGNMRPVLEAMTDAIFQDPDTELQRVGLDLRTRFSIVSLFEPLDKAFDELVRTVTSVPKDDLLNTFETLRKSVGVALDALNPRQLLDLFSMAERRLAELSPRLLFGAPAGLPGLKLAFSARVEVAPAGQQAAATATLARFDAVIELTSPVGTNSVLAPLTTAHEALVAALHNHISALDIGEAETAYAGLREALNTLPAFLRRTTELTYAEVLAGIEGLRPSHKAGELQSVFDLFLQRVRPMQSVLETATNGFFRSIREILSLLNPISLKDAVADIYDTIRQKVRLLDPDRLAESLHKAIFDPIMEALRAIDPAALKARLDLAYQRVVQAIVSNIKPILEAIADALNHELKELREAVKTSADEIKKTIADATKIFEDLVERVEHLVFVEILERLKKVVDNLGVSFNKELDRVRSAFDEMLAALPLSISGGASPASVSVG